MDGAFVDLITPPGSPARAASSAPFAPAAPTSSSAPIDLCTPPPSPGPEHSKENEVPKEAEPIAKSENKRKQPDVAAEPRNGKARALPVPTGAAEGSDDEDMEAGAAQHATVDDEDEDEEAEGAAGASSSTAPRQDPLAAVDDEDEEVQYTGRTGHNALCDFPHARFNCVAKKFCPGKEHETCSQCYCYVCDAPAAGCPQWATHCKATHGDAQSEARRRAWRQNPQPAAGGAAASSSDAGAAVPNSRREDTWSCDGMLAAIQQVYPVEAAEPAGLLSSITLRPYQKQSLAFMVNLEGDASLSVQRSVETFNVVQNHKTLKRKLRFNGVAIDWNGHPWTQLGGPTITGGWLCDEMGMGKTACITALVLARPSTAKPRDDATQLRLKATLVVCNNTLVQQWEDEVKKFAPNLRVETFYSNGNGAAKRKESALRNLKDTDVLITTPHMNFGELKKRMHFHRLVVDESHLLGGRGIDMPLGSVVKFSADHVWCVTGTPFSTSVSQLVEQAFLLGQLDSGINLRKLIRATSQREEGSHQALVDQLRRVCIRHIKAMRIGGDVALSLPEKDIQTVWLDMSDDERLLYQVASCDEGKPPWTRKNDYLSLKDLEMGIQKRRDTLSHLYDPDITGGYTLPKVFADKPPYDQHYDQSFMRSYCTVEKPSPVGRFADAAAVFLQLHEKVKVVEPVKDHRGKKVRDFDTGEWATRTKTKSVVRLDMMTKAKRLVADLKALLQTEPNMRVAIFTEHRLVQEGLKGWLAGQGPWGISEFNQKTAPLQRHKIIKEFQENTAGGAKLFVATFSVAAVGITLTAATRIFLFEPSLDPATEAQAAGRIHRLGQQSEVHIHKYAFKNSLDEAIIELHAKIAAGEVTMRDGKFPKEALAIFRRHGVADAHDLRGPSRELKQEEKAGVGPYGYHRYKDGRWGRTVQEQQCACCGRWHMLPGTSRWWGTGALTWLNGLTDDEYPRQM